MIQTVKGKIDNLQSGNSLIHEHISLVSNNCLNSFGNEWLDRNYLVERHKNGFHLKSEEHVQRLGYVFDDLHMEFIANGGKQEDWDVITAKTPVNVLDTY